MEKIRTLHKAPLKARSKARPAFFSTIKKEETLLKKSTPAQLQIATNGKIENASSEKQIQKIVRRDPKKEQNALKPAFKNVKKSSKNQKSHSKTEEVLSETKSASILPAAQQKDLIGKTAKVASSNEKEPAVFDKSNFEKKLKTSIYDTIKKAADAKKIKAEGGVRPEVSAGIMETATTENEKSGGEFKKAATAEPTVSIDEKTILEPNDLESQQIAPKSSVPATSILSPSKRPKSDTDLSRESKSIDLKMEENEVTTSQLENSEEATFIESATTKKTAQTKAKDFGEEYCSTEKQKLDQNKKENVSVANSGVQNMNAKQALAQVNASKNQTETKQKELADKTSTEKGLLNIYAKTETEVNSFLKKIDDHISKDFSNAINSNLEIFNKEVNKLIDDNDGLDWLGKKLTGQHVHSDTEIYNIAKDNFIKNMATPVNNLVKVVDENLANAKKSVAEGKKKNDEFWKGLSAEEQKNAGSLKSKIDSQYADLESGIDEKEKSVIETVTEKFSEALEKLDSLFEKALEENKSWLAKAADAISGAINTIIELGKTLKRIAAKAGKYISRIMAAPGKFFDNLSNGIGQGFTNFKNRIDQHLIKGVLSWLTGSMKEMNIVLPENYDFQGIVSLIMQILGISVGKVKKIIENIIGKKQYEFLQKGVDKGMAAGNKVLEIFQILNTEGISGLWVFIQLEFGNLKEMLIETAKSYVIDAITKKATGVLLSLLIPGAGFIRAAELLIRFVTTLFQKAAEIMRIIEGIIDTFGDILENNVAKAAEKVEKVLGGFISLAISFLAGVLGLNGIAQKVQKFIQEKIQPKVEKVLIKIGETIKMVLDKLGITKLIDKAMSGAEKGKAYIDEKKDQAIATGKKFLSFLNFRRRFKTKNGEFHTLYFAGSDEIPKLMVASQPKTFDEFLNGIKIKAKITNDKKNALEGASNEFNLLKTAISKQNDGGKGTDGYQKKQVEKYEIVTQHVNILSNFMPPLFDLEGVGEFKLAYKPLNAQGFATGMSVENLHKSTKPPIGSVPGVTNHAYETLKRKRNGSSTFYILGHLLNHNLGGSGNDFRNLTPLTRKGNKDHNTNIEETAKEDLSQGKVIDYTVTPSVEKNTLNNKPQDVDKIKEVIELEEKTPKNVKYTYLAREIGEVKGTPKNDEFDNSADFKNGNYV